MEWLKHNIPISLGSGGWKSKTRVPANPAPGESPLLGFPKAAFSLCPRVAENQQALSPPLLIKPLNLSRGPHPHDLI